MAFTMTYKDNYKDKLTLKKLKSRLEQLKREDPMENGFTESENIQHNGGIYYSGGLITFYGNFPKRESLLEQVI